MYLLYVTFDVGVTITYLVSMPGRAKAVYRHFPRGEANLGYEKKRVVILYF